MTTPTYVDVTDAGSDTSPYDTWAKSADTANFTAAITEAAGRGQTFVQTDSSATNKITNPGTITFAGEMGTGQQLIAVKAGTSAAPPTSSDLVVRGTDNLPIIDTNANITMGIYDVGYIYGFAFNSDGGIYVNNGADDVHFDSCELEWDTYLYCGAIGSRITLTNCEIKWAGTAMTFLIRYGNTLYINGGVSSETFAPTALFDVSHDGAARIFAHDFSALTTPTIVDATNMTGLGVRLHGCIMPGTFTLASGVPKTNDWKATAIACTDTTGLTTGDSVPDFEEVTRAGKVDLDTTHVLTGGADDGGEGLFAYSLLPNVDKTCEAHDTLFSPWFCTWVEGDGTSKTYTIKIANDGAGDYDDDEVFAQFVTGSEAGNALSEFGDTRAVIAGDSTVVTDDTGSTWGTGADNHQKLSTTKSVDYSGWVYGRVGFCKHFSATPDTLFVNPQVIVS